MKRKHLETIPEMAMRQIGYDYIRKFLIGVGIVLVLALFVFWLAGCATTAPAFRAASADEMSQYGLKAGAHRYEYPDATVFVSSTHTDHPEVVFDGRSLFISVDSDNKAEAPLDKEYKIEGGIIRSIETTKVCVPDTDKCSVTVQSTILVMRSKPVEVGAIPASDVVTSIQVDEGWISMLRPTKTTLRVLVLRAVELREHLPRPGGGCDQSHLTGDFIGALHSKFEGNAARLLEQNGYIPIQSVMDAEQALAQYESAQRGCIASEDKAVEVGLKGARLIAQILGTVWVDPTL